MIYNFTISADTLNGILAIESLQNQINSSTITIGLVGITSASDTLTIEFKVPISAAEQTVLTNLVSLHDGVAAIDGTQKLTLVDGNGVPVASSGDAGDNRLLLDIGQTLQGLPGDTGPQGLPGDTGPTGATGPAGPVSAYGSEFQVEQNTGNLSTTASSSQVILTLVTPVIPTGTYRIACSYRWGHSENNEDFRAEVELDGSQIYYHSSEVDKKGTSQRVPGGGFRIMPLTEGAHTITLGYWAEDDTSYIYQPTLTIERVL